MSPKKSPLAWVEISLKHLGHNLALIRQWVGPGVEVMAIVKADAYGHGMAGVSKELSRRGVTFFGVANIDEARDLLQVVPGAKVLVLGSFHPDQLADYVRLGVRPTLSSAEDIRLFLRAVKQSAKKVFPVHLKIDTGMGRLGVWHEEAEEMFRSLEALVGAYGRTPLLDVEGIYTHFASADRDAQATKQQINAFNESLRLAGRYGIHPRYRHAANSMGLARFRGAHLNLVRPGIMLYGIDPDGGRSPGLQRRLRPVLSLKARITFLKKIPAGRAVSYGGTYRAPQKTTIATVPVGYSHGYRVGFSNRAGILIRGRRCPVAGRVTMDQTLVDAGKVPGLRRWDVATLIGKDGEEQVRPEALAKILSTIPYEVVCGIHSRLPRYFLTA